MACYVEMLGNELVMLANWSYKLVVVSVCVDSVINRSVDRNTHSSRHVWTVRDHTTVHIAAEGTYLFCSDPVHHLNMRQLVGRCCYGWMILYVHMYLHIYIYIYIYIW